MDRTEVSTIELPDLSRVVSAHRAEVVERLRDFGFTAPRAFGAAVGQHTATPFTVELVADTSPLAAIGDVLAAEDAIASLLGVPVRLLPADSDRGRAVLSNEGAPPASLEVSS